MTEADTESLGCSTDSYITADTVPQLKATAVCFSKCTGQGGIYLFGLRSIELLKKIKSLEKQISCTNLTTYSYGSPKQSIFSD